MESADSQHKHKINNSITNSINIMIINSNFANNHTN